MYAETDQDNKKQMRKKKKKEGKQSTAHAHTIAYHAPDPWAALRPVVAQNAPPAQGCGAALLAGQ